MESDLHTSEAHLITGSASRVPPTREIRGASIRIDSPHNEIRRPSRERRFRVALLQGGDSAERVISLQSGAEVEDALRSAGHTVISVDPAEESLFEFDWHRVDLAFLVLHGTNGEDGQIQQELEAIGIPYTGSGAEASRLAFHKHLAKEHFLRAGLGTPEFHVIHPSHDLSDIRQCAIHLGFPLVVKPDAQGSSLGVTILQDESGLNGAIEVARELDDTILLERFIAGEEWTVPILDNRALPPIRIGTSHHFFDFEAKYLDHKTDYQVIDDPENRLATQLQQVSLEACQTLGCRGINRVDLRVDNQNRIWILEVNTIPGMTSHSLVPKSAGAQGWTMSRLCEEIIHSALEHHSPITSRALFQ